MWSNIVVVDLKFLSPAPYSDRFNYAQFLHALYPTLEYEKSSQYRHTKACGLL